MDFLGLLGVKPMMGPPPTVMPVWPGWPGWPEVELAVVGFVGGGPPVGVAVSLLGFRPMTGQFGLLPVEGLGALPMPPLDKPPCDVVVPNGLTGQPPTPPIGRPKKPMAV